MRFNMSISTKRILLFAVGLIVSLFIVWLSGAVSFDTRSPGLAISFVVSLVCGTWLGACPFLKH